VLEERRTGDAAHGEFRAARSLSSFLRHTGHGPDRERFAVKQQLESLVSEMVEKGILFVDARREFEKRFIARVLLRHKGNLSRAAKDLRIHRNTLGKKIEEYQL
jgi:transcriptional regulator with PAS, ATPase and Fis domain